MWAAIFDGSYAFEGVEGTNSEYFFWIPLLGPLIGGAAGKLKSRNTNTLINSFIFPAGLTYLFLVQAHWPNEDGESKRSSSSQVADVDVEMSKQDQLESL